MFNSYWLTVVSERIGYKLLRLGVMIHNAHMNSVAAREKRLKQSRDMLEKYRQSLLEYGTVARGSHGNVVG